WLDTIYIAVILLQGTYTPLVYAHDGRTQEKSIIKEFVTLYLRRDTYRLLDYPDNLIESDNTFLKTSGAGFATTVTAAPEISENDDDSNSEQTANATILAREQAESNEAHLKELSELRLKNTELNEHLFEALETITALMTEHGKKTGQEVESNAQTILDAIVFLRDKRLNTKSDPSDLAPSSDDEHDEIDSFALEDDFDSTDNSFSVDLTDNDATLDDATAVNLGINDELNIDLDTLEEETPTQKDNEAIIAQNTNNTPVSEASEEPSAINLEDISTTPSEEENDPWADALAEQATAEADKAEAKVDATSEEDPWADALAEQASAEAESEASSPAEEVDPWAEALAEQEKSENK
ncbi:MAG: hypothetical protein KZQ70_07555, partial [gamma proteobacterium symbiont of Lucinoma myriamae]|nr:hypothetical protein [gamma proteobacterium symbiont of Lucinoma myriamae]MCU7818590.1 hypothetical protein [gamma proteobacterium symbiont of Lucinoma myriamae]MCU7832378.1 hypothetical protein [gamma proteobacterium symbiont of Lucinoma myriamae]